MSETRILASYVVAPRVPGVRFDRAATRPLVAFGGWLLASGAFAAAIDFVLRLAVARRYGTGPLGVFALAWWLALHLDGGAAGVWWALTFSTVLKAGALHWTVERGGWSRRGTG